MHGGKLFLRSEAAEDIRFPGQVTVAPASRRGHGRRSNGIRAEFCQSVRPSTNRRVLDSPFTVVTPDSKNPYKQMYVAN